MSAMLLAAVMLSTGIAYLDEVSALPHSYLDGGCRNPGDNYVPAEIEKSKSSFTSLYSWAIPTEEAVDAVASFAGGQLIDFGAGSGYWASLIEARGVKVRAIDDWSWGKPMRLWHPVEQGNESSLSGTSSSTLMMVWPPRHTPMALNALHIWGGDKLVYVGEIRRGNASKDFFDELSHWRLVRKVVIPNWYNRNDAVWLLERATDGDGWMPSADDGCTWSKQATN